MRLKVDHHTRYRFTEPQARVVQLLRMIPSETAHQTVVAWRIDVDCDARLRGGVDGFGNGIRMLYAEGPLSEIGITVTGEVLLGEAEGRVEGAAEPHPPSVFLRTTPLTTPDEAIADFAAGAAGEGSDRDRIMRLNTALHARFAVDRARPGAIVAAARAFEASHATPRELAQIFVTAARVLGVPARYVSGYSLEGDADRSSAAPHGWAEACLDGAWHAFDPTTGGVPALDHVRVAVGLDAASAAAVAGTRIGHGREALDVDVQVGRMTAD